mgnify:CR=1 FL=1
MRGEKGKDVEELDHAINKHTAQHAVRLRRGRVV